MNLEVHGPWNTHAYTLPFNNLFSILDFNEAGDDGVAVASAGPYTDYLHLAPAIYHTSTISLKVFIGCRSK